jgi:protein-tyrosine-phosphatase
MWSVNESRSFHGTGCHVGEFGTFVDLPNRTSLWGNARCRGLPYHSNAGLLHSSGEMLMSQPNRTQFVCVENSNRSQMAEAFAGMHGGTGVEAISAGSRPSGRINPKAIEAMRECGYDLNQHQSKGLPDLPNVVFDVAVTMGCGDACPATRAKRHIDWQIPDPREMSPEQFRDVRDLIESKVKDLLAELSK